MNFTTDEDELSITVSLDVEPPALDLREQLGDALLDVAQAELLRCYLYGTAPSGTPWDRNRPATVKQKGFDKPGYRTGGMLDPSSIESAPRDIQAREATWIFPQPRGKRKKEHGFHHGAPDRNQPGRPLVGWTARAREECRRLIAEAAFQLDIGGEIQ